MAAKWYIEETNAKLNEQAFYGPFEESELQERLNDAFADWMASGLANLEAISMSDRQAAKFYINPREFWMDSLATLTKED